MFFNCLAVGAGGFLGSVLRYLMGMIPALQKGSLNWHTLLINVLGAVVIGFIAGYAGQHSDADPQLILFAKVGLCGGFTTFSTFALENLTHIQSGESLLSIIYIILSVVLCILGAFLGQLLAGRLA